ncbi:MAG TPA: Lrp/AsnC family transcriptional regulator [Kineosporiaceae bacterium]|nr:Lrp/AsnC family transcriptional regulator [Kineosporiaceae bacterium]
MSEKTLTLDEVDHQLLHALQLDPRVPFVRFARLVDVSEQTVARRFRRLRSAGVVRVVGLIDPMSLGQSSWLIRIQSRPDAAAVLADALARRPDIGWVTLGSGGSEIFCVIWSRTSRERDELLLQRLPKTAQVIAFSAHSVLHVFDAPDGWTTGGRRLPEEAAASLRSQALGGGAQPWSTRAVDPTAKSLELSAGDEALFKELEVDGRAPVSKLAELTGWTAGRVNRRLEELVRAGLLYFDTEVALETIGLQSSALLWLTVSPGRLQATGEALAGHDEVVFVAATTGTTNLVASVACRDTTHLYQYVTESLGTLDLVGLEVAPNLRRIKQGRSMMVDGRLAF